MGDLINQGVAAEILNIDTRTVAKIATERELQYIKKGKEKLYRKEDILALAKTGKVVTQQKTYMIGSPKGGTGKTTTVKFTSKILGNLGKKVLVVDADPQHYFTDFVVSNWSDEEKQKLRTHNLLSLLSETRKNVALPAFNNVDFIPGVRKLEKYDKEFSDVMGRELRLKKMLSSELPKYDYILIDTSPSQSGITIAALLSCNVLIIPIIPDVDSLEAGKDLVASIVAIQKSELNDKFKLSEIYILPTKQKKGWGSGFSKQILKDIRDEFASNDIELNIDITVLDPVMDYDYIPIENYKGVLSEDKRSYANYEEVLMEVFK